MWVSGNALKQNCGGPVTERPVDRVGMASNPPAVRKTAKSVSRVVVKNVLVGKRRVQQVPCCCVAHPLRNRQIVRESYCF